MPTAIADPAAYCMEEVRRFDHDRYLTLLFAPPDKRPALFALHAFNLEIARVRETVRETMLGQIRLQWWRDALAEAREGRPRQHQVLLALAPSLAGPLQPGWIDELLTAREFDLRESGPDTIAELKAYVAGTSSTLVQLSLDIWGGANPAAREAAHHVGMAWGLTGLLRAVPFHARYRRRYLPADMLHAAAISEDDLIEGRAGARLGAIALPLADLARDHLRAARALRHDIPARLRTALLLATLADLYLKHLERHDYALFAPPLQAPLGSRPLRLALAAWRRRY
jgi:NADH dehydrogenase [ubiquinone] 1 alpha subcomplex assembly factor 6